jgi:hypothetical protein
VFDGAFRAKVALAAVKGDKTLSELASQYEVHSTQVVITEAECTPFNGGEIVFYLERVELCGVNICSGPRSQTKRRVLELLCKQRSDGAFEAYSGEQLAGLLELKGGEKGAAGVIRDLRDDIVKCLGAEADISCGRQDVIPSAI